jgi:hypothetical protein
MAWSGATHSIEGALFVGWSGATTSAGSRPPRKFEGGAPIANTANAPLATPGRPGPPRREFVTPSQIMALMRAADVVSIF